MADPSMYQDAPRALEETGPENDAGAAEAVADSAEGTPDPGVAAEPAASSDSESVEAPARAQEPVAAAAEAEWAAQLRLLNTRFTEQERLSAAREAIITRLSDENQRLKAGELLKQMMPIYRDLMRLYDDLMKTAREYKARESIGIEQAVADWEFFGTMVTDLLDRYGVEAIPVEPGTRFEAKMHRAAAAVRTDQPERDRTIARVVSAGFVSDGRVLRPTAVEVYRFEAAGIAPLPQAGDTAAK